MYRLTRWLILLTALAAVPAFGATQADILPPGQAYQVAVSRTDNAAIHLHFTIHDGYYLYKKRFKFVNHSDGVTLGTPQLPKGIPEHDKFFGDIEIYRHGVDVTVPYTRTDGAPEQLVLEVVYQGCADIGFCYPPQHASLNVTLPEPGATDGKAGAGKSGIPSLLDLAGGPGAKKQQFLPPDQAFVFGAEYSGGALHAHWQITKGYYMYRDRFQFAVADDSGVTLGQPDFPKGEEKDDENFGKVEVYRGDLDLAIPVHAPKGVKQFKLEATYQGCADAGLCYPPIHRTVVIDLTGGAATIAAAESTADASQTAAAPKVASEQDRLGEVIRTANLGWVLLVFFGAGLLLTFTPCVLPMLPIISSLVVGQGEKTSTGKAFIVSLVYVLGMAFTYTAAGVAVALAGASVQAWFQNLWVLGSFAALFVLLSLAMFGVYELQMPAGIQARLAQLSNRQQGGTLIGAAIMGVLSALIVGPCVSAPLVAALVAIGQSGEPVRGGLALFSLSLGMGVPLIIAGTSAGKFLPRAGAWMDVIKAVFGFLLLGLAVWFIERVAPAWLSMLAYALLALAAGLYFFLVEAKGQGWRVILKTLGAALLIWGAALLVGLALGNRDPLQPLANIGGSAGSQSTQLHFTRVKTVADLDRAVAQASAQGHPVMLDFYADWCVSCKEMDAYVFTDPKVKEALANAVLLRADVTANDAADQALLKRFGLYGPPGIMFFDARGNELKADAVVGYMPAVRFRRHVLQALGQD